MLRKHIATLPALFIGAAIALTLVRIAGGHPAVAQVPVGKVVQPDTSSPNWKFISDDLGVLIRKDEALGLRARLFVRRDGMWLPVATDGPGDTVGAIPLR